MSAKLRKKNQTAKFILNLAVVTANFGINLAVWIATRWKKRGDIGLQFLKLVGEGSAREAFTIPMIFH